MYYIMHYLAKILENTQNYLLNIYLFFLHILKMHSFYFQRFLNEGFKIKYMFERFVDVIQ